VVTEVTRSLQSFYAAQPGATINTALVAGGTGLEADLVAALRERLGVRCELLDPAGGFGVSPGPTVSAFTAALGLAAGQATDALPFDFINPKRPRPPRDTRRLRAAAILTAVVVALGGGALARSVYLGRYRAEVSRLERHNRQLRKVNKAFEDLRGRVEAVEAWAAGDVNWLDQLAHLSNTLPPAQQVYLTSLRALPTGSRSISGRSRSGKVGPVGTLILSGRVKQGRILSGFATRLMNMPGYEVKPKGTSPVSDPLGYGTQFSLDVLVARDAKPVLRAGAHVGRPPDDMAGRQPRAPLRRPGRSRDRRNRFSARRPSR